MTRTVLWLTDHSAVVVEALLHSLWISSAIGLVVWVALRQLSVKHSNLRYGIALSGLLLTVVGTFAAASSVHRLRSQAVAEQSLAETEAALTAITPAANDGDTDALNTKGALTWRVQELLGDVDDAQRDLLVCGQARVEGAALVEVPADIGDAAEAGGNLVIDFAGVEFMSSVGLRSLTRAAKLGKEKSVSLGMANLNETLTEIFQITRFNKLFKVSDSVDAALEAGPDDEPVLIGIIENRITRLPLMTCVDTTKEINAAIRALDFERAMELRGPLFRSAFRTLS